MAVRFRKSVPVAVLVCAGTLALVAYGAAQGSSPLSKLADDVLALFPKVDGDVLEIRGQEAVLSFGKRDGLQTGVQVSLYRRGRPLKHPKTGEVVGHAEQQLATVPIREVAEAYSTVVLPPGAAVVAGDRARISAGRVTVTIVMLVEGGRRADAEAAGQEIFEALGRTGRFRVTWGDMIAAWLAERGVTPEAFLGGERLAEVATKFKPEYVLALRFRSVQKRPLVDAKLFAPPQMEPLLTTAFYVPASVRRSTGAGFSSGGAGATGQQVVKRRSLLARLLSGESEPLTYSSGEASIPLREVAKFPFVVRGFDVHVSPHDGVARVAVTDGSRIFLYRLHDGKFEPEWTYGVKPFGTIVSLQLADVDGDGVLEVIVNRHHWSSTHSFGMVGFILGQKNGRPQMLVDNVDSILVAMDEKGTGTRTALWSQAYDREKFFAPGDVTRVEVRDGKIHRTAPVLVPAEFRATGATMSNTAGKAAPRLLAYIDVHRRLRISSDREDVWRSSSGVGGGGAKLEINLPQSTTVKSVFFNAEPFPLAVDLDGDGIDELLVPQNVQADGMLAVVYKGPAGYRLQSVNSGFEGLVHAIGAIPGGDRPTLVVAVVRARGVLGREGETQIIMTTSGD